MAGWKVLTVWECETRGEEALRSALQALTPVLPEV